MSYLQPAETRPGLVEAIADDARASRRTSTSPSSTPAPRCCGGCAASATRRASSACSSRSARWRPQAGVRSNVIVGFPGETEEDLADAVRLPRRGPAWTSPGSSATPTRTAPRPASYDGKLDEDEIRARVEHVTGLVEELTAQRAEERIGEEVDVLVERVDDGDGRGPGRPPGPRGRRHHDAASTLTGVRGSATWSPPTVVGTDGRRPGRPSRSEQTRMSEPRRRSVSNWNVPNVLTTLRIVMVPFFGWALLARRRRLDHLALRGVRALRRPR